LPTLSDVTSRLSSALADRYRIDRQLGEDGMATVYLASGFPCAKAPFATPCS
jgi:hypothetical protein